VAHALRGNIKLALAAVPIVLWPVLVAAAKVAEPPSSDRYAFIALPPLFLMVGWVVSSIRWNIIRSGVAVILVALAVFTTIRYYGPPSKGFREGPAVDPSIATLIVYLKATGQTHVFANYWIAYVLSLDSNEQIMASATGPVRYPPYAYAAALEPKITFVFAIDQYNDVLLQQWMNLHAGGERTVVGIYAVYRFDRSVNTAALPVYLK
jgi:hypothetical protein